MTASSADRAANAPADRPANRLVHATSPYLLQHAHNPVDWYEWGAEALARAKAENRPIFLSVGYSACHWCHVMERESFESPEVAAVMNRLFVNIKVDREERPDIDEIYMTAVQILNQGHGGWPMSVWMTPELKPFAAGTYFPPHSSNPYGRPGFIDICSRIGELWQEKRDALLGDAANITEAITAVTARPRGGALAPSRDIIANACRELSDSFDAKHGGFGRAPKFPPSMPIELLYREYAHSKDPHLRHMADFTLFCMACGGMYDQIGGGFARYSVDDVWLVPHFEKMLYDNALLLGAYLDGFTLAKQEGRTHEADFYSRICRETFEYVLRDLRLPDGGFASAEDADSEGEEGKFYVWDLAELRDVLGDRAAEQVAAVYGVTPHGNFEHTGKSILHLNRPLESVAQEHEFNAETFRMSWPDWRAKLLDARNCRVRPGRDDKVLAAWNALMITSLARGYEALGDERLLHAARRCADFMLHNLQREGRLLRSWRNGHAHLPAYQEDYAFFAEALLSLYEATADPRWLAEAKRLCADMLTHFYNTESGSFYFTAHDHEQLIVRTRPQTDGATPSGSSVAVFLLLKLGTLLDRQEFKIAGERTLTQLLPLASQHPRGFSRLLSAADLYVSGFTEVAMVCAANQLPGDLLETLRGHYLPNRLLAFGDGQSDRVGDLIVPLLAGKPLVNGQPVAYICRDFACQAPASTPQELNERLRAFAAT